MNKAQAEIFQALLAWRKAKSDQFDATCKLLSLSLTRNLDDIRVTPNSSLLDLSTLARELSDEKNPSKAIKPFEDWPIADA